MNLFKGTCTALITPFHKDGTVDFVALEKLIEYQLENGTDALISLGTTGEASTLSLAEKVEVVRFTKKIINGRTQFIVGTGSNCTATACENAKMATEEGADAILAVTPYYNKCTQNGIIEYYKALRSVTPLPIIAYNVPSRTGVNIIPETFVKAFKEGAVNAIKEASGNMAQITELAHLNKTELNDEAILYSGDDGLILPTLAVGGQGIISVLANPVPKATRELTKAFFEGNFKKAQNIQLAIMPLVKALFCEVNPTPVKAACAMISLCENVLRSPLLPLEGHHVEKLQKALNSVMAINYEE